MNRGSHRVSRDRGCSRARNVIGHGPPRRVRPSHPLSSGFSSSPSPTHRCVTRALLPPIGCPLDAAYTAFSARRPAEPGAPSSEQPVESSWPGSLRLNGYPQNALITQLTSNWCRCNIGVMKRTQIHLPDRLYERLKDRAANEESTLAEIMRKAGEYYLAVHPEAVATAARWTPPAPRDLGEFLAPEDRWREMANDKEGLG